MADTPKRVIRLIDNIKLELYESGRKKYVQVWDPTGNNTYNEDDKILSIILNKTDDEKINILNDIYNALNQKNVCAIMGGNFYNINLTHVINLLYKLFYILLVILLVILLYHIIKYNKEHNYSIIK
jgi:hypothetical protein